jgi:hypothetical protein
MLKVALEQWRMSKVVTLIRQRRLSIKISSIHTAVKKLKSFRYDFILTGKQKTQQIA